MSPRPWYKHYSSDWLSGVMILSAEEKGVYITLLNLMYDRRTHVQLDAKHLARMCGCSTRRFKQVLSQLVDKGKIGEVDGHLTNPRFDWERKREKEEHEKRSKSGKNDAQKIIQNVARSKKINGLSEDRYDDSESYPDTRTHNHTSKRGLGARSAGGGSSGARSLEPQPAHIGPHPEPPPHPARATSSNETQDRGAEAGIKAAGQIDPTDLLRTFKKQRGYDRR